jgi:disulfide oxidoreductase YuzD
VIYKTGTIKSVENGKVLIEVDMGDEGYLIAKQKITDCEVSFGDGRKISPKQRKYIYGLIKDIAVSTGEDNEAMKEVMKDRFCNITGTKDFSLSNVDMTTAKNFLDFLVDFCIEYDIPTRVQLSATVETASRFVYACCAKMKCCVYNTPADIYDAKTLTNNIKPDSMVLPLSDSAYKQLTEEGLDDFETVNYVKPIKLDAYLYSIIMAARKAAAEGNAL